MVQPSPVPGWEQMWDIFHEALERPAAQREALLETRCGGDAALAEHVRGLLRALQQAGDFIEPPTRPDGENGAAGAGSRGTSLFEPRERPLPERISRYVIERRLGEGGFAEVFLAQETGSVERPVALKVLKPGMDSRSVLARFEAERQTLALLDHPNITTIFDAGLTEDRRPYFAMEYVQGSPITDYCDERRMKTRDRLRLFMAACQGVQHAHHKGVIHRDLKPSNVLVTELDGVAAVKVIDFGIAKAISEGGAGQTMMTEAGQFIGTPEYTSPEQAGAGDVDTRSDVYSLGVLLYELLSGGRPFQPSAIRRAAVDEVLRMIREEDPPRPSQRVTRGAAPGSDADRELAVTLATRRNTTVPALTRELRGDLDWIVMKAMEKDRTRRYGSPAELASDVERHLGHEPVVAGPPGAAYRLAKFVRRHRAGVFAAVLVTLALVAAIITTTVQAIRATRSENRALALADSESRQARIAQAVNDFLTKDVLASIDPRKTPDREITMRQVIDAAATRIGERFKDEPLIEAEIRRVIGDTYRSMGVYADALKHLELSCDLFVGELGEEDMRSLQAINDLAILYRTLGRFADAEPLYVKSIEIKKRTLGEDEFDTVASQLNLGVMYRRMGRLADAEPIILAAVEKLRQIRGPDHNQTIVATQHLVGLYVDQQRFAEAEPLVRATLDHQSAAPPRGLGEDHPYTLVSMSMLAQVCAEVGKPEEAEQLFLRALSTSRRRQGERHIETATLMGSLGQFYREQKRYDEALEHMTQSLDITRAAVGEAHASTLIQLNNIGTVYDRRGQWDLAEPFYAQAASGARQHMDPRHRSRGAFLLNYARCLQHLGRVDEVEIPLMEAREIYEAILKPDHPWMRDLHEAMAEFYEATGRPEDAAAHRAILAGQPAASR